MLVDFGLVAQFARRRSAARRWQPGRVLRDAVYMAPEQIRGELRRRPGGPVLPGLHAVSADHRAPAVRRRRTEKALLGKHLEAVPHRPSELVGRRPAAAGRAGVPAAGEAARAGVWAMRGRRGGSGPARRAEGGPGEGRRRRGLICIVPRWRVASGLGSAGRGLERLRRGPDGGDADPWRRERGGKTRLVMETACEDEVRACWRRVGARAAAMPGAQVQPLGWAATGPARRRRSLPAARLAETERLLGARGRLLALYEPELRGLPGQDTCRRPEELPAPAARERLFRR